MTNEPFIAHSELTNEIYIVQGRNKYRVTEQAIHAVKAIKALEQEPKTGHWIFVHPLQADDVGAYICSSCKVGDWGLKGTENFCPNCGCAMVEPPQESEGI